ncbi:MULTISPECIES: site-specific integrase [Prevotellaceae]|uniref:site-specific integrase n=1 Tax=Prevotellaceae TaxID=171552 RepID=UPI0003D2E462|nr:site-specific integrase [Prevotella phocaeensis]ETD18546.1 hypothetical protein HMPREF1199_01364 [Hoylesella oralis CC98A]
MNSIKVKISPPQARKEQSVIHKRVIRQLKTNYRIYAGEWSEKDSALILVDNERNGYLQSIKERINWDIKRLENIVCHWENNQQGYTADNIISAFQKSANEQTLFNFINGIIARLKQMGKHHTSGTYHATLRNFMQFRENKDVLLDEIDSDLMLMYEAWLHGKWITKNSSSFYMRILRAVYNRAVEKELTSNRTPFKHVYTRVDKTIKRAIPLKSIKKIKNLDLSLNPALGFARDMFLSSFYTCGMSFIDMAHLKKKDLQNGILSYRRRKTGQQLIIKWEKCMQGIVDKYNTDYSSPCLLPILNTRMITVINTRTCYIAQTSI